LLDGFQILHGWNNLVALTVWSLWPLGWINL
jgi:hypothetical protein